MINLPNYIKLDRDNRIILKVYACPGAKKTGIHGIFGEDDRLKIKISAPPVDGAANLELIKFIAKLLNVKKTQVEILRGEISRNKDFLIDAYNEISHIVEIINSNLNMESKE